MVKCTQASLESYVPTGELTHRIGIEKYRFWGFLSLCKYYGLWYLNLGNWDHRWVAQLISGPSRIRVGPRFGPPARSMNEASAQGLTLLPQDNTVPTKWGGASIVVIRNNSMTYTISEEWLCLSCDKKREQTLREERLASERAKSAESDVTSPNNTLMAAHSPTAETTDPGERQHVTSAESGSVPSHLSAAQDGDDVARSSTRQRHSHRDTAPPASQHAEAPEHCIPGCKHRKGKGGGDMLRCCLCGKWYHIKCLELTKDEIAGVWPCMTCRYLSDDVRSVNLKIDQFSSDMERVLVLLSSSLKEIQKQRDDTLNECVVRWERKMRNSGSKMPHSQEKIQG